MDELKNGESRLIGIIRNSYAAKDYKTTSATIETLKAKHPETQYIAECGKWELGCNLQKAFTGKTDTYTIQVQGDNGYVFNFTGVNTSDRVELE